jgi:hypothetical protein
MKAINILLAFTARYEHEVLSELPSSPDGEQVVYYPGASSKGGTDGILVRVKPAEGSSWIGIFAFGYESPNCFTAICSCPNENTLCVVSQGQGFIVNAFEPRVWEEVKSFPILDVRDIVEKRLLVFADFTSIAAYGVNGLLWTTERLVTDDLKITEVTAEYIKCVGWDGPRDREIGFLVDVDTGLKLELQD